MNSEIRFELNDEPPFMTVQRVAKIMDASESTIRRYIRGGELVAIASEGPNSAQILEA